MFMKLLMYVVKKFWFNEITFTSPPPNKHNIQTKINTVYLIKFLEFLRTTSPLWAKRVGRWHIYIVLWGPVPSWPGYIPNITRALQKFSPVTVLVWKVAKLTAAACTANMINHLAAILKLVMTCFVFYVFSPEHFFYFHLFSLHFRTGKNPSQNSFIFIALFTNVLSALPLISTLNVLVAHKTFVWSLCMFCSQEQN